MLLLREGANSAPVSVGSPSPRVYGENPPLRGKQRSYSSSSEAACDGTLKSRPTLRDEASKLQTVHRQYTLLCVSKDIYSVGLSV